MGFRILNNKDNFFLILLLIAVGGILLWQNYQFMENKTELVFSKIKATMLPESLLSEDSGLDLSEINLENLLPEKEKPVPVESLVTGEEGEEEEEEIISEYELALSEIEEKVGEITKEVEKITQKVDKLLVLTEIQNKIDRIAEQVEEMSREVDKLMNYE